MLFTAVLWVVIGFLITAYLPKGKRKENRHPPDCLCWMCYDLINDKKKE